jgi:hypothetical protein
MVHIDERTIGEAFRAPNGELAWPRAYVAEAVDALRLGGFAILGGEVWVVIDGKIDAQPRLKDGQTAVISWDTRGRDTKEPWARYVARAASETLSAIRSIGAEDAVAPELRDKVFYNFSFVPAPDTCTRVVA